MRRATLVLSLVGLLWSMAACGSGEGPRAAPAPQPSSPPASLAPVPPTVASPTGAPPSSAPPQQPSATPTAAPPPSGGPSGEVPGPLPFGARTLTGTVQREGDCTMLLVGQRRWALTGAAVAALSPGDRVTVRGGVAPRPAACGDRDLAQTVAVDRVDPA